MPRILAIDWDRLEARAVLMQSGPTGTSLVGAWVVPCAAAEGTAPTARQIGSQLSAALSGETLAGATTLVGVGRDQVQMVLLSLPPAPPEELPELVRFQAERELTSLGADAALDFIPLSGDASTPYQVLAAALAAGGIGEVRDVCQALGVEPDRITLRATAAASFVARRAAFGREEVSLVANRLTDEADLTVLVGDQPVLARTVRLPDAGDAAARSRVMAGEIRRTAASVRQQLADRQVGRVVLCGATADAAEAATLAEESGLAVEMFDVAEHAPAGVARTGLSKDRLARCAAVLGMALGEADRRPPVVDFLNVRRRVELQRIRRSHVIAASAAAAVLLLFALLLWQRSASLTRELHRIDAETAALNAEYQHNRLDQALSQVQAIDRWLATDVNWLDELDRMAEKWRPAPLDAKDFPADQDAAITQLTIVRPPGVDARGGRVFVQGVAKNSEARTAIESRLRDESHRISGGGERADESVPGYLRAFELTMDVAPTGNAAEAAP